MKHNSSAKCILTGEHAVLRGGYAIAVPLRNCQLNVRFESAGELQISVEGLRGEELKIPFLMALERALDLVGRSKKDIKGHLQLHNDIPIGAGLGASAAYCIAVVRLFIHLGWCQPEDEFRMSREVENLFHGESSGLDVAVILENKPLLFHRAEGIKALEMKWKPNLFLSYSGNRGLTADCVNKVKKMFSDHPEIATSVDEKMKQSVALMLRAMTESCDTMTLKESIDLGMSCFQDWNLVNANLREHIQFLRNAGAIAVKPTGSGDGGYVLSLWPEGKKPEGEDFISVF